MWPRLLLLVAAGAALELSSTTARTPATNTPSPSSRPTTGFASSSTSFSSSSSSSTSTKGPTPPPPAQEECVDLVDFCDQLKPVCIGTIIVDQLTQLASIADEIDKSTALPALQNAFSPDEEVEGSGSTHGPIHIDPETIENNLPLIKESLPLIRESLPLIRESLPLIRQFMDPLYYSGDATTCQRKITCKSCRECPKLRDAVTSMVEALCPATCRVCGQALEGEEAAENLVKFYL